MNGRDAERLSAVSRSFLSRKQRTEGAAMKRFLLLVGVVFGVGVWWFALAFRDDGERKLAHETDVPAGDGDETASAPPARRDAPVTPGWNRDRSFPTATVPVETAAQSTAPAEPKPELTTADQRIFLQSRFAIEKVDVAWATTARQEVSADLAKVNANGVTLQGVECHASLCRAELVSASPEAALAFSESYLRQRTWTGPGFMSSDEQNPDGTRRTVMFLGRPGTDLPHLE
jgi:hypothetical protein